jgi:lipid-A-disaccharide synthase-like uncharacterized protein
VSSIAPQLIGFSASAILLATLAHQVWKQWSSGKSEGVSPLLFAGQVLANIGMLTYSILLRDLVFITTNTLTLLTALLGFVVQMRHAARQRRGRDDPAASLSGADEQRDRQVGEDVGDA